MSIHFSSRINKEKNNIFEMSFPLATISDGGSGPALNNTDVNGGRRMVIFLGNDFRNLPSINLERATQITNQCLDYVRRECSDCDLFYKLHPAETDEYKMLNLEGFALMEKTVVEVLYMKYAARIEHVFSLGSLASVTAHNFGLNSSLFLEIAASALGPQIFDGFRKYFSVLPEKCFINDFSQSLRENKKETDPSEKLENQIRALVASRSGTAWMLIGDPNSLPYAKTIDTLIKKHNSNMRMHLVISWHHRWNTMPIDEVKKLFNAISVIPRVFYSLHPKKILKAWRTARMIRNWPVSKDDVVISRLGLAFTDDCFASYFRHIPRVALMPKDFFDLAFKELNLDPQKYRKRLGATFFNRILEPLLGIERTEYLENIPRTGWNIFRYVRPVNDIFDEVWVY